MTRHIPLSLKTRPQTLTDLKGQEVLTRTLTNAISSGKIAHGYIFTGIRGVGKTSTARIFAKSLNCLGVDGKNTLPTATPCGVCENCQAISESRHMDVIELDAASHTGVDNMRSILDESRYRPVAARYKIYIIDEVHMLSTSAFNAMLKTLEEPPEHVIFILATTELQKVPITILSRCQRFNLPRISINVLQNYYGDVAKKEGIDIDLDALHLIAREADGSARDGMSLLDQAIALSHKEKITVQKITEMLGRTSTKTVVALFDSLVENKVTESFELTKTFVAQGGNPKTLISDLLDFVYRLTQTKSNPDSVEALTANPEEQNLLRERAQKFSYVVFARLWQLLLKGIEDLKSSENAHAIFDMLCVRVAYLSSETIQTTTQIPSQKTENTAEITQLKDEKKTVTLNSLEDVCKTLCAQKEMLLASVLQNEARIDSFETGKIVMCLDDKARDIQKRLKNFLKNQTQLDWIIELIPETNSATLSEEKIENAQKDSLVSETIALFKGAKIENVEE
ncbi:MAG: DNA polymerase III subunit gamma/tau [Alphaproteobacteria bacterium]|nr:DNA polymerase III subunit gamma/tau [Alphaproteobacteria bacterium]